MPLLRTIVEDYKKIIDPHENRYLLQLSNLLSFKYNTEHFT
ncbi:hypothetical protein R4Z10_07700 [Niallia sp. XMNu-256]